MFSEGQQIGHYTLVRKLGKGGFGEVWLAERRSEFVTTLFALKFPLSQQIDLEAVKHEAQLWAQANGHPNVLPIIEASIYDGQVAIISEFAPDGSLEQLLKEKTELPQAEAVEMAIGILRGLEFLHSRNIIHRDIKPANVLLQGETPRLTDFGISRVIKETSLSITIAGTPKYMAPEAFDGKRNVQTDIWSVGVILYLMLKGDLPFPQEETTELLGAIVFKEPEPLPGAVPQSLQKIVKKALAKKPAERYQTAREMRDDLQKALVGINHPTFAPTEIFHKPFIEQTETPTTQTDAPTVQTNAPLIQTEIQPTQTEKETEQFTRPAVEANPTSDAPSIVTQINPSRTDESAKPLPTVAQAFADKTRTSGKFNKFYFILPAIAVLVIVGGGYFFLKSKPGVFPLTTLPPIEASQLIPYRKGDKWGYSDAQKRIYIEPRFQYQARPFFEDLALVTGTEVLKLGYIDKTGNFVIQPNYDIGAESFSEGLAKVRINNKYGFINKSGNLVVQPIYDSADSFSEGLAKVCIKEEGSIDDSCGFIDKNGKEIIPLKYFHVRSFSEGLASVKDKTDAEKLNIDGKKAYSNKPIFIDKTGKTVLQTDGIYASPFFEGWFCNYSTFPKYFDKTGKVVLETKFAGGKPFSEGLAAVYNYEGGNQKWGFIDKTGNLAIQLHYDWVNNFSEGLARVEVNKKCGFIDKTGKIVIPLKYDCHITSDDDANFKNGIAKVKLGESYPQEKEFYIGKDGTEYYEP